MRITYERFQSSDVVAVNVDGKRVGTYRTVLDGYIPQGRSKARKKEADARYIVIVDEAHKRLTDALSLVESVRHQFTDMNNDLSTTDAADGGAEYDSWLSEQLPQNDERKP